MSTTANQTGPDAVRSIPGGRTPQPGTVRRGFSGRRGVAWQAR